MIEPKPFASLSSDLLARKGMAKPAMRPQGFASLVSVAPDDSGLPHMEDLGWNDMGQAPAPPIVEQQRAAIEASLGKVVQIVKPSGKRPEHDASAKAAFTLRINAERHLKLRLACAVTGRSAQQLITEALDQMLESKPIVETLAKQLPARARKQK